MLGFFRSVFQSKLGVALTLGFLVLIALAFASADITGSSFGGVAGGDRAAVVGKHRIGTAELSKAVNAAFERARQQNPGLTMPRFVAIGGVGQVLDDMIDRYAVFEFGRRHGIVASDRLIDSEIVKIPAFRGPDGQFSQQAYQQMLAQQGLSDAMVRDDLAQGLVARQVLVPVAFGARAPEGLARRYATLRKERRSGAVVTIPAAAFAPKAPPSEQALQQFYAANRAAYVRPERRTIRYALFGDEALKNLPAPTDAEVAKAYDANKARYAPSETRTLVQVVLPTEAAAQALAAEVRKGASLEAAAKAKGLLPSTAPATRQALSSQTSPALADAAFTAAKGALVGPARSGLGWHVARIEAIDKQPGKTLDQARAEIVQQLAAQKRRAALTDMSAKIEDQFDQGGNLAEVAKDMGLTVETAPPVTANGQVVGDQNKGLPPELAKVVPTAFQMDRENEPQLAEVEPGKRFVLFDVAEVVPAAPPPLVEVRERVARDWALAQGSAAAKAAADKLVASKQPVAEALRALGIAGAQVEAVDKSREELLAAGGKVPAPLALMFSMAQGTAKRLEAPGRQGWFVVRLDRIVPGAVVANDPVVPALQRQLGEIMGREYADAFRHALRKEVGAERNQKAVGAVVKQLTGGGGQ